MTDPDQRIADLDASLREAEKRISALTRELAESVEHTSTGWNRLAAARAEVERLREALVAADAVDYDYCEECKCRPIREAQAIARTALSGTRTEGGIT